MKPEEYFSSFICLQSQVLHTAAHLIPVTGLNGLGSEVHATIYITNLNIMSEQFVCVCACMCVCLEMAEFLVSGCPTVTRLKYVLEPHPFACLKENLKNQSHVNCSIHEAKYNAFSISATG